MSVRATIRNDEPEGSPAKLAVTVVTVGNAEAQESKHLLAPGDSVSVEVNDGQFLMVDETEKD